MNCSKTIPLLVAAALCLGVATESSAQARGRAGGGARGGAVVGRAVPRGGGVYGPGRVYAPGRVVGVAPYRPYYYPYRPGVTFGFYANFAFGYPYFGVGVGYPYYGYGYPYYRYPYYGYPYYGYPYYGAYGYPYPPPPPAYVSMQPGVAYGGVRIQGVPHDAQIMADGYYVGVADDFDGPTQHLNLTAGVHKIEVRTAGQPPLAFDVNVQAGQTITYHAGGR